jgi:hypothetical protein
MKKRTEIPRGVSPASPEVKLARAGRNSRDIEIINRNADWLNAQAEDVLRYQATWDIHDAELNRPVKKKSRKR